MPGEFGTDSPMNTLPRGPATTVPYLRTGIGSEMMRLPMPSKSMRTGVLVVSGRSGVSPTGSSSLSSENGVGSSARSTITYGAYVGCACMLLVFAQPDASARSVLARK